jgi:hypothetical protein
MHLNIKKYECPELQNFVPLRHIEILITGAKLRTVRGGLIVGLEK